MNKEYLKELYDKYENEILDSEQDIDNFEDFSDYIKETISSNIMYDFDIDVDEIKLFQVNNPIDIEINNGGILRINQTDSDKQREGIGVEHLDSKGNISRRDLISEGDFVMLMNYYYYIKDHDIKDGFINREGTNDRKDFFNNENESGFYL